MKRFHLNIVLISLIMITIPLCAFAQEIEDDTDYIKLTEDFIAKFRKNINNRSTKRLKPMFAEDATIIVGKVGDKKNGKIRENETVFFGKSGEKYLTMTSADYLKGLKKVFKKNSWVKATFSSTEIKQNELLPTILSVTLKQQWKSQKYSDTGWLYIIVDYKDLEHPEIKLRLWQIDEINSDEYMNEYASLFLPDSLLIDSTISAEPEPLPGEIREFDLGQTGATISMAWIPAGECLTSGYKDKFSDKDEYPLRSFTIENGFWISQYEVKKYQWDAVVKGYSAKDSSGKYFPATEINWNEIKEDFLGSLNAADSVTWRLPSETEWEYACRAGSDARFPWGMDENFRDAELYAWTSKSSDGKVQYTGQNLPNIWNLYDICGNVYEWVEDDYHSSLSNAPLDSSPWIDNPRSDLRVLKSGSALMPPEYSRVNNRSRKYANTQAADIGFRLVREAR